MHFVDNIDLVTAGNRCKMDLFPKLPDLINSAVAGRIDFNDIGTGTFRNFPTMIASIARMGRWPLLTVQGLSKDPRRTRLTRTARACKQVSMGNAPRLKCVRERFPDVFLPHEAIKILGSPSTI